MQDILAELHRAQEVSSKACEAPQRSAALLENIFTVRARLNLGNHAHD
jgi:hypothetical protein